MPAVLRSLLRTVFGLRRSLFGEAAPKAPPPPADPRAQDPWLGGLLAALGDRYQLGEEKKDGLQLLRRTGRARFNPMLAYVRAADGNVVGVYEVRGHGEAPEAEARALLDARVTAALGAKGLAPAGERTEDWGGKVLIRRYEGRFADAALAAAAVKFLCEDSDQQMDTAAE